MNSTEIAPFKVVVVPGSSCPYGPALSRQQITLPLRKSLIVVAELLLKKFRSDFVELVGSGLDAEPYFLIAGLIPTQGKTGRQREI